MLFQDPVAHAGFIGLLVECPLLRGNPVECQLHEKRKLPLAARYEWSRNLTISEAQEILRICSACMTHKRAEEHTHCRSRGSSAA